MFRRVFGRGAAIGLVAVLVSGVFAQGALATASATASPTTVDFGKVAVGTTGTQTLTITNTGDEDLWLNGVSTNPPFSTDFDTSTCPGTIVAGGSCTITLTMQPTRSGKFSTSMTVQFSLDADPSRELVTTTTILAIGRGCRGGGASCK